MADIKEPVYVTRPYLPELSEFIPLLQEIWDNGILTNGGPFHQRFERALEEFLGVPHVSLFCNGTIALVTALQALRITGEVITTPYSFVATAHSLLWNGIKPVFVDVDPQTLNIDPSKIEAAISPQTTAILPVHVYGNPCNVRDLQKVADNYNLKLIYDAAHAFGVRTLGQSLLNFGDLSVLSFHATKVFNTFEGGAIVCHDAKTKQRIERLKNFGFVDETTVVAPGINGKMNEFSAALGLMQLGRHEAACLDRAKIDATYRRALSTVRGIKTLDFISTEKNNFSYFPIFIGADYPMSRDELYYKLREKSIYARRYFYPLITEFPMYRGLLSANRSNLPIASDAADQVLCLPIFPGLQAKVQEFIIDQLI